MAIQDQTAKFECLVDANPKAKIIWLLNGKELTNKDNVKIETDAKTSAVFLVIPKVLASHIGAYTIKASNNVGEVEHTFTMDALGKYFRKYLITSKRVLKRKASLQNVYLVYDVFFLTFCKQSFPKRFLTNN